MDDNILIAAGTAGMDVIVPSESAGTNKGDIKLVNIGAEDFDITKLDSFVNSSAKAKMEVVDVT